MYFSPYNTVCFFFGGKRQVQCHIVSIATIAYVYVACQRHGDLSLLDCSTKVWAPNPTSGTGLVPEALRWTVGQQNVNFLRNLLPFPAAFLTQWKIVWGGDFFGGQVFLMKKLGE